LITHEIKITFFDGADDEIGAPFEFRGKTYFGNGLTVGRMKELKAFFDEMHRDRGWGITEHLENIKNEIMYTTEERGFLLFVVTGSAFEIISQHFNKK